MMTISFAHQCLPNSSRTRMSEGSTVALPRRPFRQATMLLAVLLFPQVAFGQMVATEPTPPGVTAAQTGPADAQRLEIFDNYDLAQDGRSVDAHDPSACAALCEADSSCKSFTFDKWEKRCVIAGEAGSLRFEPSAISGIRAASPMPLETQDPFAMECYVGREIKGVVSTSFSAEQIDTCAAECAKTEDCVGFAYHKDTISCSLLKSANELTANASLISGVKRQSDPRAAKPTQSCTERPVQGAALTKPSLPVNEKALVVVHQRCVLNAFETLLRASRTVKADLPIKALDECEKLLLPLRRRITASTHDVAFAESVVGSIRSASRRGLTVAILGYLSSKDQAK